MKKQMTWMFAAMLATSVTLGGCGGGGNAPQEPSAPQDAVVAEEETANPDEQVEQANPAANFMGTWKLAYIQSDGLSMVGDLAALEEATGENMNIGVTFNDDGTGKLSIAGEDTDLSWELNDAGELVAKQADGEDDEPMTFKYEDGEIMGVNVTTNEDGSEDTELVIAFSADGKSNKVQSPKAGEATPITSAEDLVGDWNLSGMSFMGVTFKGDSAKVAEEFSDDSAATSFKDDGTCTFFGEDCTYAVDENGATIDFQGVSVSVKHLGDEIIIDLTDSLGSALGSDSEFFFLYTKA